MHVVATAGHVDHGKSTLVRALTGMEPDRWAEEHRRGLTIDLGFAWTELPSGRTVAFVDVPGHERFVQNMLTGAGQVPAVVFVVAADEGWMPQSAEHLAALEALGVVHGLLVVTRADLADPSPAARQARERLAGGALTDLAMVTVSARAGTGLDEVRVALDRMVARLPEPDRSAPVRLWVDRAFTVHGSGTVVTGTLPAGTLRAGDRLDLTGPGAGERGDTTRTGRRVRVRGLQTLGRTVEAAGAVARVAVNVRGVDHRRIRRGAALVTPGAFHATDLVDVRLAGDPVDSLPPTAALHLGSAAVTARIRPLGHDTARLRLPEPLPLHVGDRALLRDPGRHHIAGAVTVLDVAPPPLDRRGAAGRRAAVLADVDGHPDERSELRRRQLARRAELARAGIPVTATPVSGDWLADPQWWAAQRHRLREMVAAYQRDRPLAGGVPVAELCRELGLPGQELVEALVAPPLVVADGWVRAPDRGLPEPVGRAVARVRADLTDRPFRAPEAGRLAELRLGPREIAAAEREGELLRVADGVVLLPDAPVRAAEVLAALPQPFPLRRAREALDTTRRVAVPLLELLDRHGVTRRLPDDRRELVALPERPGVGR